MSITAINRAIKMASDSINLLLKKYNDDWVSDHAKVNRKVMGDIDHAIFNELNQALSSLKKGKELLTTNLNLTHFNAISLATYLKKEKDKKQFLLDNPSYGKRDPNEWLNDTFVNISQIFFCHLLKVK